MSRIIRINAETDWYAANWAAEHVVRLVRNFLPTGSSQALDEFLEYPWRPWDADLSELSPTDVRDVCLGAEVAFAELTRSGPSSQLFDDPDFFPSFVDRFREFLVALKSDPRVAESYSPDQSTNNSAG